MIKKLFFLFLIFISACSKHNSNFNHSKIKECKKFVIVIPSFNNQEWYESNLKSVFKQQYANFRIIYIDDNSTDQTYTLVKKFIKNNNKENITTLIKNNENLGAAANHYKAINLCNDNEIIVSLDGDDCFYDDQVLAYLNQVYQDPNIWLTYGQFKNWPTGKIGWCKSIPEDVIKNNNFREFGFCMAQPRTYYTWLAKKIKIEDLKDINNKFYKVAGDVALMFPMIEMAGDRFKFIEKILCSRNVKNQLNDFKINKDIQKKITREIKLKKKYQRLSNLLNIKS